MRAAVVAVVIVAAVGALAARARADDGRRPRSRLEVERGAGAGACPDRRALAESVAGRLGYDPFVAEGGDLAIRVQFARDGDGLAGVVEAFDPSGAPKGEKRVASRRGDCSEVAEAATLTITILLDPRSGLVAAPREERPEPTPFEPPPAPTASERPSPPPPPKSALVPRVRVGAVGSVGAAPSPTLGARASVGLAYPRWAVDLELRADLPQDRTSNDKRVTSGILGGVLAPCLRSGLFEGCGVLLVGALRSEADKGSPASDQSLVVAAGPRLAAVLPLGDVLALDLHADALFAFTKTTLRVDGADVWTTPLLSALVGAALEVRFP